ncbi:aldo/keto reductase [Glycomyces buryatensis]|uniref:Aldo/keto reductase n=1 Tax=Glycomyces buryatensis TaxID=2570927 RepID=A0A4S8PUZ3_9ACTN|nr:aldo/keto reductase [Glycomyces buryatensis]
MREHRLRTGTRLTELGFGAAQLGNLYRETTEEEARAAVAAAWDAGVRYFDTAPHYGLGLSERRLGAALASRPRDDYTLSTKVGRLLEPTPERAHLQDDEGFAVPATYRRQWDFSRDGILRSIEGSLDRLGTDRIDIVYLHDPDEHWDQASTSGIETLVELRDQGVIAAVGVGMNQSEMPTRFVRETDIDVVMCAGRFTLVDRGAQDDLLPAALARGVAVVAAGVYNSGLLANPRPRDGAKFDYQTAPPDLVGKVHRIADAAEPYGVTVPELAARFALRHPAVASVVLGMRTADHVTANAARLTREIPEGLWDELDRLGLSPRIEDHPHTEGTTA